jgi:hypothetical protein
MTDINTTMAAFAKAAVQFAAGFKKNLDYSESSIQLVEAICESLYADIPKNFFTKLIQSGPSENKISQMAQMLGAYVGEVIRKNYGGSWALEEVGSQGKTIVLNIGETKVFPVAKLYKRLKNGPEDNVYHYYQLVTKDLARAN